MEASQIHAKLYAELCEGIAEDADLIDLARQTPVSQPPPNILFGAAHYLLLKGAEHPVRDYYPNLANGSLQPPQEAFPSFRDFCLSQRDALLPLIETKLTQTNVIKRCLLLLPAFSEVYRHEIL